MLLKAKIGKIDGDRAFIALTDGQQFTIPLESIHGTPKSDSDLRILISTGSADQPETQDLARSILNELIGAK